MIVPHSFSPHYQSKISLVFGEGRCHRLRTRPVGSVDVASIEATRSEAPRA